MFFAAALWPRLCVLKGFDEVPKRGDLAGKLRGLALLTGRNGDRQQIPMGIGQQVGFCRIASPRERPKPCFSASSQSFRAPAAD